MKCAQVAFACDVNSHVHRNFMRCACGSSMRRDSPLFSRHVLHYKKLIWEHLDPSMNTLFSRSMFSMVFLLFFNTFLSSMIELESPKDSCMHPT